MTVDRAAVHTLRHGRDSLMLKGLDPLLNADILAALRAMGQGDELAVSDANFPADSVARRTMLGRILRMEVVDAPDEVLAVHREVQSEIDRADGRP